MSALLLMTVAAHARPILERFPEIVGADDALRGRACEHVDRWVIGTVTAATPARATPEQLREGWPAIATLVTLTVERQVTSDAPDLPTLELRLFGGTVGDRGMFSAHSAWLEPGERYALALRYDGDWTSITPRWVYLPLRLRADRRLPSNAALDRWFDRYCDR